MLLMEEDDLLVLTSVIPKDWISLFEIIEVKNAPSYFGTINYKYEVLKNNELLIQINNQYTHPPRAIEINLPVQIKKIIINEAEQEVNDQKFLVAPSTTEIKLIFLDY